MNKLELFKSAISNCGLQEIVDGQFNSKVLKMLNDSSHLPITKRVSWCAAFVNHVLKINGYNYSDKLTARSLMKIGKATKTPVLGDIVVLWRGKKDSWKGHVGFYVSESKNLVYILGGNQDRMVCIKCYPKNRLLGYRSIGIKK
ncbi:MAG: TIGR02594 family protein [Pseudomonadota bacterium]